VREHRGEHTVGDPQPVALDEPLHGEGDRDQQDGDAGGEAADGDEDGRGVLRALGDVLLKPLGGAVRHRGHAQDGRHGQKAEHQPHQVGGPVHTGGQQGGVATDLVVVGDEGGHAGVVGGGVGAGVRVGVRVGRGVGVGGRVVVARVLGRGG
jgi:hypothetical protein